MASSQNNIPEKASPRLLDALEADDQARREIQVVLRTGEEDRGLEAIREAAQGDPIHYALGIASFVAPLARARDLAALDSVMWLDLASTVPIEELLDHNDDL